jgi:hypothetical protein
MLVLLDSQTYVISMAHLCQVFVNGFFHDILGACRDQHNIVRPSGE